VAPPDLTTPARGAAAIGDGRETPSAARDAVPSARDPLSRLTPARGLSSRAPGLRLFGVAALDAEHSAVRAAPLAPDTELVTFRELGAVVAPAPFGADALGAEELEQHRAVVEHVFAYRAIVPAPPGTVFRTREALASWLELHYFTLIEALNFVESRAVARVTVRRDPAAAARLVQAEPGVGGDVATDAAETLRALRRAAVALVVVREGDVAADDATPAIHASFLVERARWGAFIEMVGREAERRRDLQLACTGPWPPYDFVRMQLAG
jgi:hypothetical protein